MNAEVLRHAAAPNVSPDPTGLDDDLDHFYCCNSDVGLCGVDLSAAVEREFDTEAPGMCLVCHDLDAAPCRCDETGGAA